MIAAFLASFLFAISTFACDFSPNVKGVFSLSGSVSLALRDLNLVANPKLKGVSIFHPIEKKNFKGSYLPGGIFLAHGTLKGLSGQVLFYDESRELTRVLSKYKDIETVEIKTRTLSPGQVLKLTIDKLAPFIAKCDTAKLSSDLENKMKKLEELIPKKRLFLFFLGLILQERFPDLIIVQDGVVKWMVERKLLKTYPSQLSYVNWSSKLLHEMPRDTFKIGLKDSGSTLVSKIDKKRHTINVTYPGALIPGVGQVDAMIYLFQNL